MITDDQLDKQLRAANPFPPKQSLTDLDRQAQQALYEEIINMSDTEPTATPQPARRMHVIVAFAVAVVAAASVVFVIIRNDDDGARVATNATTTVDSSPATLTPSIGLGSCVEVYSLETLRNRAVAFDGTVASIDGSQVTFTVNHWYKGGDGATATLDGNGMTGGAITSAGALTLLIGDRYLVAGDDGFVWSCGFTQPFDETLAQMWRTAFNAPSSSGGG